MLGAEFRASRPRRCRVITIALLNHDTRTDGRTYGHTTDGENVINNIDKRSPFVYLKRMVIYQAYEVPLHNRGHL